MNRLAVLIAVFALAGIATGTSSGHMLPHSHNITKMKATQELAYGQYTVRHAKAEIADAKKLIAYYKRQLHPQWQGWVQIVGVTADFVAQSKLHEQRVRLYNHRWLVGYGHRLEAHARARMVPPMPWAFWKCVATGIYPGRGRVSVGEGGATSVDPSGTYYGRYQFDWGFMRNHGSDMLRKYGGKPASSWSVVDQTIVAERGFHVQGPMAWPNTAPPCLGLR